MSILNRGAALIRFENFRCQTSCFQKSLVRSSGV